jgi:hypothetical protein
MRIDVLWIFLIDSVAIHAQPIFLSDVLRLVSLMVSTDHSIAFNNLIPG